MRYRYVNKIYRRRVFVSPYFNNLTGRYFEVNKFRHVRERIAVTELFTVMIQAKDIREFTEKVNSIYLFDTIFVYRESIHFNKGRYKSLPMEYIF